MLLEFLLFLIMIYNSIAATGTHTIVLVATHMNPSQNKDWLPFKFSSNSLSAAMYCCISIDYVLNDFNNIGRYPSHITVFQFNFFPLLHRIIFNYYFPTFMKNK